MRKLSILVIPSNYPQDEDDINGIFVVDYLKSIQKHCDIAVLDLKTGESDSSVASSKLFGFETIRIVTSSSASWPLSKYSRYLKLYFRLNSIMERLRNRNFDIIHTHGSVIHGYLTRKISRKIKVPYLITEHTNPFSKISDNLIFKKISKIVINDARALLTVSEHLLNEIRTTGINYNRCYVTYNPIDTSVFKPVIIKKRKQFIFVSRLEAYKGGLNVVKAFFKIHQKHNDWKLVIIGDGPELMKIQNFVEQNELRTKVKLMGKLKKQEIAIELNESSIFVNPSQRESFGIVIGEAMSCGLPVIVGNQTAPKEFVKSEHGILVDPISIDEIANAMDYMCTHLHEYNSSKISDYIRERFSFETFGNQLLKIYHENL